MGSWIGDQATLDALTAWRHRAEPLLTEARTMLADDVSHAPHLAAMPCAPGALADRNPTPRQRAGRGRGAGDERAVFDRATVG